MDERTRQHLSAQVRLRFMLGAQATDVVAPAEAPLVDLLPAVLAQFGPDRIEQGADHEGWVARRLGGPPLDEERTPTQLQLVDGETVHLCPRADGLPPIDHDDLVDGVAERVREHPRAWSIRHSRRAFLGGSVAALAFGLWVLGAGGPVGVRAMLAGGAAAWLLLGAAVAARGLADTVAATVWAGVAAAHAALAGWLLVSALDPAGILAVRVVAAAAGALAALALGMGVVGSAALLFTAALTATLTVAFAALIGSVGVADAREAAAVALAVTLPVGLILPATAFRLGGLRLPQLPGRAEELHEDVDPIPHQVVAERAEAASRYLAALHVGLGAAQILLVLRVAAGGGGWAAALAALVAAWLLLRSRHLAGAAVQRWAVLAPATVAAIAALACLICGADMSARLMAGWAPALVLGFGLLAMGRTLPGRRLRPYWGRAADILETLTALAVLPVLGALLHVYAWARGLSG